MTRFLKQDGEVLKLCVGLAITGEPFIRFNDPSMRALTSLALKGSGEKGEINPMRVRDGVIKKAQDLRKEIKQRLKGRNLNISADFGSRNGFDFFGEFPNKRFRRSLVIRLFKHLSN